MAKELTQAAAQLDKHFLVIYTNHRGYLRFYASICEDHGEALIKQVLADLDASGVEYKTQRHWDCDTASREYDE